MSELTQQQIDRQDFVDNNILEFLNSMQPEKRGTIEHDIELVGKVRDAIQEVLVDDLHMCTEMEFYPYIETE
jgi:hypothetical protein